jgi:hypothetical protein
MKGFTKRIEWAGPNITIDDAQRAQRQIKHGFTVRMNVFMMIPLAVALCFFNLAHTILLHSIEWFAKRFVQANRLHVTPTVYYSGIYGE